MKKNIFVIYLILILTLCSSFAHAEITGYNKETNQHSYFSIGHYTQGDSDEVSPILWRILEVNEDNIYLLSDRILFAQAVHHPYLEFHNDFNLDVRKTTLFKDLNSSFIDKAFSDTEKSFLYESPDYGYVSLPAADDIKNAAYGFIDNDSRMGYGTKFALENKLFMYSNGSSPYWTRTPSTSQAGSVRCTKVDGNIGFIRCQSIDLGVRPVIWIKSISTDELTGDGTLSNPYKIIKE